MQIIVRINSNLIKLLSFLLECQLFEWHWFNALEFSSRRRIVEPNILPFFISPFFSTKFFVGIFLLSPQTNPFGDSIQVTSIVVLGCAAIVFSTDNDKQLHRSLSYLEWRSRRVAIIVAKSVLWLRGHCSHPRTSAKFSA